MSPSNASPTLRREIDSATRFKDDGSGGRSAKMLIVIQLIAALALLILIVRSPDQSVYDESYHLAGARLLTDGASVREYLTAPLPSAPGPLYGVVHALASPLTALEAPAVRVVSWCALLLALMATSFAMHWSGSRHATPLAGMMLSVPLFWVVGGLALTEISAVAMSACALAAAVWGLRSSATHRERYFGFACAGIFAGLAITGRQTYLPLALGFPLAAYLRHDCRLPSLLGLLMLAVITVPVFAIWGGLTRPNQTFVSTGIAWTHGLLAFAYLGILLAIIVPRFFIPHRYWMMAAAAAGAALNLAVLGLEWPIAAGVLRLLPSGTAQLNDLLAGTALMAVFGAFVGAIVQNVWIHRADRFFVLGTAATVALNGTAIAMTHLFASRYVTIAFPFALLMARPFFTPSPWASARLVGGSLIGAASLTAYYG